MLISARSWICSLLVVSLAACSSSKDKDKTGAQPRTKGEALDMLSPQHRANFENWTRSIVKSCSASEAFGLGQGVDAVGIDGAAILMKNGGSLVFGEFDVNSPLAALTDYSSFSGVSETTAEQEISVNGETYTISAKTNREGSACEVTLFGVKVFSSVIAENFHMGVHYQPGKAASAVSTMPLIRQLGANSFEAVQHGVFPLVAQTFRPASSGIKMIAAKLGLNDAVAAKYIKEGHSSDFIVRLANEGSAAWTGKETADLIAARQPLVAALGSSAESYLEVRLKVPVYTFDGQSNEGDGAGIRALVGMITDIQGNGMHYSTRSVTPMGTGDKNLDEAFQCAQDRARAFAGVARDPLRLRPSVHVLLGPCEVLDRNIEKISYERGFLKSQLSLIFAGVTPSRQLQYGGWGEVLSHFAVQAVKANRDIRSELDPEGRTSIVGTVAQHLDSLKAQLVGTPNLANVADKIYGMGMDWSFAGERVGADRIGQILRAAENSYVPFNESTLSLIMELAAQPFAFTDQLAFAEAIDAGYKAEAQRALNLARDLSYKDFESEVFARVVQQKTPVDDFRLWNGRFEVIKAEINKYVNVGQVKNELVGASIKWLKSGEAAPVELSGIYASVNNALVPFEASAKKLVSGLINDPLSVHRPELAFAQSLSPEYKQLALAIRENSKASGYEDWGKTFFNNVLQDQPSLDRVRIWGDLWTGASAFTARENARTAGQLSTENEWNRKKVVDRALQESWGNADFVSLEAIADLARYKSECERHKGMSSLSECAGMNLFSRSTGKFLDPAFGGRYVGLSKDFAGYVRSMTSFDYVSLKGELLREFFQPVWSRCDTGAFQAKAASLKADVTAILATSDHLKRFELERSIRETLRDCR